MSDTLKKGEEIGLSNSNILDYLNKQKLDAYLTELNELRKENDLQKEVIAELNDTIRDLRELLNIQESLNKEVDKLSAENHQLVNENCELNKKVFFYKGKYDFYLSKSDELSKEIETKNNPQDNNTRLQGLIDEVFGLLNELDINLNQGYENEGRKIEYKIKQRLKIINTLK